MYLARQGLEHRGTSGVWGMLNTNHPGGAWGERHCLHLMTPTFPPWRGGASCSPPGPAVMRWACAVYDRW